MDIEQYAVQETKTVKNQMTKTSDHQMHAAEQQQSSIDSKKVAAIKAKLANGAIEILQEGTNQEVAAKRLADKIIKLEQLLSGY